MLQSSPIKKLKKGICRSSRIHRKCLWSHVLPALSSFFPIPSSSAFLSYSFPSPPFEDPYAPASYPVSCPPFQENENIIIINLWAKHVPGNLIPLAACKGYVVMCYFILDNAHSQNLAIFTCVFIFSDASSSAASSASTVGESIGSMDPVYLSLNSLIRTWRTWRE